nr:PREDICTED: GMP reductase 1-like [Bemisia tabaci]
MPNITFDVKLDFKDVLLRPKRSTLKSRSEVDLHREIIFKNSKAKYNGIPIVAANMDTVGTFEMAKALSEHDVFTAVHKYYTVDEWEAFAKENPGSLKHVALSSGCGNDDFKKMLDVTSSVPGVTTLCLDVANGYQQSFVEFVRKVRETLPKHTIIAGNVVTVEMVEELVLSGADVIKVGIGPGSVCTTRYKTGVGYPQLSAVMECADAARGLGAHVMSDGGCTCPGDVAKAFAGGADFVMLGGMLAGHDQCGGELITKRDGSQVKQFYGMSSSTAMQKHVGGVAHYRSAEGKCVEVSYRGDVNETIMDILGGLRSTCTYTGAAKLKELSRRATFIRCTQQLNQVFAQSTTKY